MLQNKVHFLSFACRSPVFFNIIWINCLFLIVEPHRLCQRSLTINTWVYFWILCSVCLCAWSLQLCPTVWDPMDHGLPGSLSTEHDFDYIKIKNHTIKIMLCMIFFNASTIPFWLLYLLMCFEHKNSEVWIFVFFLKFVWWFRLWILGLYFFPFLQKKKNSIEILIWIALNLQITVSCLDISTILDLQTMDMECISIYLCHL